jgi:hypothetical protein
MKELVVLSLSFFQVLSLLDFFSGQFLGVTTTKIFSSGSEGFRKWEPPVILHVVKDVVVVFSEVFSIHPSVPSSIHGWHHTGKKILTEINNPPPPSAHVSLSRKGMPGPRGGTPKILISILSSISCSSGIWGIYLPSPIFYHGQLYVTISRVTSSANIKIFNRQGPDEYMWNVVYREVLEM